MPRAEDGRQAQPLRRHADAVSSQADHDAALALQRSLIPAALPEIPGADLAARYIPGRGRVGGDWYDVFVLPSGEYCVVLGDVAGSGLAAAVIMGRMRSTLRSYALETSDPADILSRLDRKMQYFEPGAVATVACAVLDPTMSRARISLAGHLPLILAVPGQGSRLAGITGDLLIGASADETRRTASVPIPPGAVLGLYTDGLVERRDRTLDEGVSRLLGILEPAPADQVCAAVMAGMMGGEAAHDDLSLLIIRRGLRQVDHAPLTGGGDSQDEGTHGAAPARIRVVSIYEPPSAADGQRILIDTAWPRNLARRTARVDTWVSDIAPSGGLRRWLGEDATRFGQFRRCYLAELREPQRARALVRLGLAARRGRVTLLTAEPDAQHCPAAVVAERLRSRLAPAR